jgi:hypothetical protein
VHKKRARTPEGKEEGESHGCRAQHIPATLRQQRGRLGRILAAVAVAQAVAAAVAADVAADVAVAVSRGCMHMVALITSSPTLFNKLPPMRPANASPYPTRVSMGVAMWRHSTPTDPALQVSEWASEWASE